MLDDAIDEIKSSAKRAWNALTSALGQSAVSTFTVAASYVNQGPNVFLADVGIIAGIGVSITLIALNLLKFIKEFLVFRKEQRKQSEEES